MRRVTACKETARPRRVTAILTGMRNSPISTCRALGEDNRLPTHAKARAFLENFAKRRIPITYQELPKALQILPPRSIHRVTEALERLMDEDAAAGRPFIAALAISKARGGLPAPGFFDCARRKCSYLTEKGLFSRKAAGR